MSIGYWAGLCSRQKTRARKIPEPEILSHGVRRPLLLSRPDIYIYIYTHTHIYIYIYIYGTPPHVPTPFYAFLLNLSFGKVWVLGMPLYPHLPHVRMAWVLGLGESACNPNFLPCVSTRLRPGPNYRVFKRIQGVFN